MNIEYTDHDDTGFFVVDTKWYIEFDVLHTPGDWNEPPEWELQITSKQLLGVTVWTGDYGHELPITEHVAESHRWLEGRLDVELVEDKCWAEFERLQEEGRWVA